MDFCFIIFPLTKFSTPLTMEDTMQKHPKLPCCQTQTEKSITRNNNKSYLQRTNQTGKLGNWSILLIFLFNKHHIGWRRMILGHRLNLK